MKKIIILALFISFLSCIKKDIKNRIKEDNNKNEIENNQIDDELKIESTYKIEGMDNLPKSDVEIGSDEWKKNAQLYLDLEEGETYYDFDNKKLNTKNPNKVVYSTKDIEYSEEWKVRAYKATKEHIRKIIPKSLPNCKINSFGYYNPYNLKYIGNNTFRVKIYLTIKCGSDDYENRKYFWFDTGYSEYTNQFEFSFIKERFAD